MKTISCDEGYTGEKCEDCDEKNGWIKNDGKCIFMYPPTLPPTGDRNLT